MALRFKGMMAAAAAVAMTATPAMAANPAASLSVGKRAGTPVTKTNKAIEGSTATFLNIGILAALTAGVLLATTTGDDSPDSP